MPVMALLPMLLVRAKFSWQAYLAAMAGVLSHLLLGLDECLRDSIAVAVFAPASAPRYDQRVRFLDLDGLIDWRRRACPGETGDLRNRRQIERWSAAWLGVVRCLALISFEGLRFASHQRAIGMLESRLYQGGAPAREVIAVPAAFANPFVWRGIARGNGFVDILSFNVTGEFDPSAGENLL